MTNTSGLLPPICDHGTLGRGTCTWQVHAWMNSALDVWPQKQPEIGTISLTNFVTTLFDTRVFIHTSSGHCSWPFWHFWPVVLEKYTVWWYVHVYTIVERFYLTCCKHKALNSCVKNSTWKLTWRYGLVVNNQRNWSFSLSVPVCEMLIDIKAVHTTTEENIA